MKSKILLSTLLATTFGLAAHATVWTVANSGNTFTPANITIVQGDTVVFNIANIHNVLEVSQSTYNANGTTALAGGFSVPFGGGTLVSTPLATGTHWYVCEAHASMGMKGTIVVTTAPTGIMDVLAKSEITISPNPTSDFVNIKSSESLDRITYSIVDVTGKQLTTGTLQGKTHMLNIQALAAGQYYLYLGNGSIKRTLKIEKI